MSYRNNIMGKLNRHFIHANFKKGLMFFIHFIQKTEYTFVIYIFGVKKIIGINNELYVEWTSIKHIALNENY